MSLAGILPGVLNVSAPEVLREASSGPTMDVNGGRASTARILMTPGAIPA